jgi:hypothetical protein
MRFAISVLVGESIVLLPCMSYLGARALLRYLLA